MTVTDNRRPLKSRGAAWAAKAAAQLAAARVAPDLVSASSLVFAAFGGAFLMASGAHDAGARIVLLIAAALCIQLRLLANLLDGMVAVEHGKGGPLGPIWNELPDRIADVVLLVGAGWGAAAAGVEWAMPLGWLCAVLAVLTAYIRELGRALGQPADFRGPLAKPHRMALLTGACLISVFEGWGGWRGETLAWALVLLAAGTTWTAARRTLGLAAALRARG